MRLLILTLACVLASLGQEITSAIGGGGGGGVPSGPAGGGLGGTYANPSVRVDVAYCPDTSVSANTITCTVNSAKGVFASYSAGESVDVLLANTVTGATTINLNALGNKAVTYNGTNALTSAIGWNAGATARLTYDGTRFVMQGIVSTGGGTPGAPVNSVQFNNPLGTFAGDSRFTFDPVTGIVTVGTKLSAAGSITDAVSFPFPYGMAVQGNLAYVANDSGTPGDVVMAVVDITKPSTPVVVGTLTDNTNFNGAGVGMAVSGRYTYMANATDRVGVIDVSKPFAPVTVATVISGNLAGINDLKLSGNFLYVGMCNGAGNPGVAIIDVSNPLAPKLRGTVTGASTACTFFLGVSGRYVYAPQDTVTAGQSKFTVIDVSNPDAPTVVGTLVDDVNLFTTAGSGSSLLVGKTYFVTSSNSDNTTNYIAAIDVSTPTAPTLISISPQVAEIGQNALEIAWPYAYLPLQTSLYVFDIRNPASITLAATFTSASVNGGYAMAISGTSLILGNDIGAPQLAVLSIGGEFLPSATIGAILNTKIDSEEGRFKDLYVWSGISAGPNGIASQGPIGSKSTISLGVFLFVNFPAIPSNGMELFCSDCTVTSAIDDTCAGSGSGAFAFRIAGAWKCNI